MEKDCYNCRYGIMTPIPNAAKILIENGGDKMLACDHPKAYDCRNYNKWLPKLKII